MANDVKIGVSAEFDQASINAQIQQFLSLLNATGKKVAEANKATFKPVSSATVEDMRKVNAQFDVLIRNHSSLRQRMAASGQKGKGFFDLDWEQLFPDPASRARQMEKAFSFVTGHGIGRQSTPAPAPPPGGGTRPPVPPTPQTPGGSPLPPIVRPGFDVINQATGGSAGVVAGAVSRGASSGIGAGLTGLLGGLVALGLGKLASMALQKVESAEANDIAYDTLKRRLGDVNVSFAGLKESVKGVADMNGIVYEESAKLSTEFAKLSGASGTQGLVGQVGMGIGLSRGFGLEPGAGVGVLGSMRGLGITKNEADTRRFALLVGETIGKSGAFSKADEVIGAIGDYASIQSRQSMGANISGFAGMLSGLIGAHIPGLDVKGSAGLLARVNSSLMGGGAKGEASQFFTASVGRSMGLDPLQTQMLREGGSMATVSGTFGPGSIASRFGMVGPKSGGNKTFLQASLDMLRRQYGNNKGLLAQATANHLGINMSQAAALLSVQPAQMGDMSKFGDLTNLSGAGISGMSKALFGSASDVSAMAQGLRGRQGAAALTTSERGRLESAMAMTGPDALDKQRQIIAELVATRDQESTQGKDIRDSKAALDNLKTNMAEKLVPYVNDVRLGVLAIAGAGKDGQTPQSIMRRVIEAESQGRIDAIKKASEGGLAFEKSAQEKLSARLATMPDAILEKVAGGNEEILSNRKKVRSDLQNQMLESQGKEREIKKNESILIGKEIKERNESIIRMQQGAAQGGGGNEEILSNRKKVRSDLQNQMLESQGKEREIKKNESILIEKEIKERNESVIRMQQGAAQGGGGEDKVSMALDVTLRYPDGTIAAPTQSLTTRVSSGFYRSMAANV